MALIDLNGLGHFKSKENAMVAAVYSATKTYAVGDYVYYNGTLYRCTTAITTAEAWASGHWAVAKIGDDVTELKTALTTGFERINGERQGIYIAASTGKIASNAGYVTKVFDAVNGAEYHVHSTGNRLVFGLYDSLEVGTDAKGGMYVADNSNPSVEHSIVNTVNAKYLVVFVNNTGSSTVDAVVYTETHAELRIDDLEKETIEVESNAFDWRAFSTQLNPYGWVAGYYSSVNGSAQTDSHYLRNFVGYYQPDDSVINFTVTAPDTWAVAVFDYNADGTYVERHGDMNTNNTTATKTVTVTHTSGHKYRFSIGRKDNAATYITLAFVQSIVLKEEYSKVDRIQNDRKNHLNILVLGNSYSADSFAFVPYILKKYGITCNIHFYYRGSGSVDRLVAEWESDTGSGTDDFGTSHLRRFVQIDTRYRDTWTSVGSDNHPSPKSVLEHGNGSDVNIDKWDMIVLNQGSRSQAFTKAPGNGDPRKGTEPYLRQLIDLIRQSYNGEYTLAWFGDYTSFDGYDGNVEQGYPAITPQEMDNRVGVLKSTETIMGAEPFDMIIPTGAAVFNARTNSSLASTNITPIGNLWCSDKIHLQAGIPEYIVNCAVVQSIFNKFYPHLSILGDDTRITDELLSALQCPFINNWAGNVMTTSDDDTLYGLAQKCAITACNKPYDITPIYLPTDTTELELFDTHSDRYWADALITQPSA